METLKRNGEFRRAYARGKSLSAPAIVCCAFRRRTGATRYGVTASKKVGNSVARSRCRRVLREAFRTLNAPIQGSWDLVFIARARTRYTKSTAVRQTMRAQLRKMGVIK